MALTLILMNLVLGTLWIRPAAPEAKLAISYVLRVDTADLTALRVRMQVANAPREFTLAAHAHPEYDDKYWRYIEGMQAAGGKVTRKDSVLWQVHSEGDAITINYLVRLPVAPAPRAAWRAHLMATGGLIGGPHSFLYVVGAERAPATVTLELPAGWANASALERRADALHAPDIFTLMESPILVGRLRAWQFDVARVPHRVFYLPAPTTAAFDSTAFVQGMQRIVEQTVRVFGSTPYQTYTFLMIDDAYGGLEHPNSVTLGARSSELAENPYALTRELAHEFFHTWNLMRIKPIEYRGVDYRVQPPVPTLWFSEGMSIFYADLLMRRAGFSMEHPTRVVHLQNLLTRYANDPAYDLFSAEAVSRTEYNSPPGALGNHDPSPHLVGEVIGVALDAKVRAATDGRRTLDDVMRGMDVRHARVGFTSADVEHVVGEVCVCDVRGFFDAHVRGAGRIDMNSLLRPLGLRLVMKRVRVTNERGEAERDLRVRAWQSAPDDTLRLHFWNASSIWVRAGLNTNDRVLRVNGVEVKTWPDFRTRIVAVPIGQKIELDIVRAGEPRKVGFVMSGYEQTRVEVAEIEGMSPQQRRLLDAWAAGR
ncbi:MAG TPA: hypothetical protein VFO52_05865 [Longimicrobiales bacterium]|nr:hypothetical protein [Longimicrobiales bacterium]